MCKLFDDHNTAECDRISKLTEPKIKEFIEKERLCFKCMRKGHMQSQCETSLSCKVCHQGHASCLRSLQEIHSNKPPPGKALCNRVSASQQQGLTSMIVPVYVSTDGRQENEVMVYALIDSQSDTSFIDKSIPHLHELENKLSPMQDCDIGLLIGYNCPAASFPLNSVKSTPQEPYGLETPLGWMVVGGVASESDGVSLSHRIRTRELSSDEILKCLQEHIEPEDDSSLMSQNDLAFMKLMESNLSINEGFYTMPLPFRRIPELPNNRQYALKGFRLLEGKFNRNPQFKERYHEFMLDILQKGEAELHKQEDNGWYIPHFGVFNLHKPVKICVVFGCSAKYQGQLLNMNLLQGPDPNSSLAGLLCRFRKERVVITCDIKKMFHQFRVTREHRKYLKFLWYEDNVSKNVVDYQMNVHLFGAVSSPSCAIFGLQQLVRDYAEEYPDAAAFVLNNFYVDDGLISVSTPDVAIRLMEDATSLTSKGNLLLHKFLSNDMAVAKALGCEESMMKDLNSDKEMITRALGLCWDVSADSFHFSDKIPEKPLTRRGILSTVASVFDPLGMIAPFTLTGKLFIQELCREKKSWDDPLSPDQIRKWTCWLEDLTNVTKIGIDRCFLSKDQSYDSCKLELHTFSDACEYGYGVCSYIRILTTYTQQVSVSLVMGKARVAPQKILTIPRLELQAATLAVKIGNFLIKELKFEEIDSYFWSDSETVLGYISNEVKRFHTFVLNRVERIRESTTPEQWHYVSTTDNPADIASRGSTMKQLPSTWFDGPTFLSDPSFQIVNQSPPHYVVREDDPEVKKVFAHTITVHERTDILHFFERFSSWTIITNIFRYIVKFSFPKHRHTDEELSEETVFKVVLRMLQNAFFSEEIEKLKEDLPIAKTSGLYKLDPFIDDENIIRVGGRIKDSLSPYKVKHPAGMPAQAHVTKIYAQHIHKKTGHQGKTTTMNHIRMEGIFLAGQGNRMLSSMIFKCVQCIKIRGKPSITKMANLPSERVEATAPFTHSGMDVFGPFYCKDGRKEVKRYGLIFSCLSTRAVHLEMLQDMTTDSFINSLRCFLALRGSVDKPISSDQKTSLRKP